MPIASDRHAISVGAISRLTATPMTPEFILGADRDSILFGAIGGIGVSDANELFVLDPMAKTVRVFSTAGEYVRSFGREGDGPDELRYPRHLTVWRDTVFIMGPILKWFSLDGDYLGHSDLGLFNFSSTITGSESGVIVSRRFPGVTDGRMHSDTIGVYRFQPKTGIVSKVFAVPEVSFDFGKSVMWHMALSTPHPVAFSREGDMYYSASDSFHLNVVSPQGDVERTYTAAVPRVRTSDEDFDDFAAKWQRFQSEIDARAPDIGAQFQSGPRARWRPEISGLIVSHEGQLLIQRLAASNRPYVAYTTRATMEWLLLDETMEPKGRVLLPPGFVPLVFRDCGLYGWMADDSSTPLVVKYRLTATDGCSVEPGLT